MAEAGEHITAHRRAAIARIAAAADPASAFPSADLTLTGPEGSEEPQDLVLALAEGRRRDIAAGRTLVGPHRADLKARYTAKDAPADQCSTGEQKALLISLILANARALAQDLGRAPILLLDEVAAHLDEARRSALYDEICALGAQALMTGTETGLFAALGDRGQTVTVRDTETGSQITME
jgi:DNA replication and repair protein RecF